MNRQEHSENSHEVELVGYRVPVIGGVAAALLLVLLFGTHVLRGERGPSRWRDRVWLSG